MQLAADTVLQLDVFQGCGRRFDLDMEELVGSLRGATTVLQLIR
jgi:hypothetical protein